MKRGRTIVAAREQPETASERMATRQKMKRKRTLSVITVILILIILVILAVMCWQNLFNKREASDEEVVTVQPTVEIIDEAKAGVSERIKEYVGFLEQDFADLGYRVTRVDLPRDKSRELLVGLDNRTGYIKVNVDRGTGVTAEDADRMIRYLDEKGITFEYIDVRVEGRAFYK